MTKMYLYSTAVFVAVLLVLSAFVFVTQPDALTATAAAGRRLINPITVGDAPYVSTLDNRLYFSGQPTPASLQLFRERGVKTVINLRLDSEMSTLDFDEASVTKSLGMTYISIPIGGDEPSEETLSQLFDTIADKSAEPLLLHCATSRRAGYVWAMYEAVRGDQSLETAIEYGRQAGMNSPVLEGRASAYIARHLAARQKTQ